MTVRQPAAAALVKEAGIGDASRREQAKSSRDRFEKFKLEAFKELEAPLVAKIGEVHETRAATAQQLEALELRVTSARKTRNLLLASIASVKDAGLQPRAEKVDQDVRILEGVQRRL